jgi:hypothetical protein
MDAGIVQALGQVVQNPLPPTWLGYASAPPGIPDWANIGILTGKQVRALMAQIAYDASGWNYQSIGSSGQLGRYQISTVTLENYGLLLSGANAAYGSNCVNYQHCWVPGTVVKASTNSYTRYIYNTTNLLDFLTTPNAQEHLAYQLLNDYYAGLQKLNAVQDSDSADTVAGMLYVAWVLGVGTAPGADSSTGTGAYAWRYSSIGAGATAYNSGRYAVMVLAQ